MWHNFPFHVSCVHVEAVLTRPVSPILPPSHHHLAAQQPACLNRQRRSFRCGWLLVTLNLFHLLACWQEAKIFRGHCQFFDSLHLPAKRERSLYPQRPLSNPYRNWEACLDGLFPETKGVKWIPDQFSCTAAARNSVPLSLELSFPRSPVIAYDAIELIGSFGWWRWIVNVLLWPIRKMLINLLVSVPAWTSYWKLVLQCACGIFLSYHVS